MVLNHNIDTTSLKRTKSQLSRFVNLSLGEMRMIDIWRELHLQERDYTHYSAAHKVHTRIDYFLMNKTDIYRVKECRIGGADLSDHNPLYLEIYLNSWRRNTVWRLNVGLLNCEQRKIRMKAEIQRYVEENDNGAVDPTIFWDAMKVVIRGRLIAETAYMKKVKSETFGKCTEQLRELEREHQTTKDAMVLGQIELVKAEINDL